VVYGFLNQSLTPGKNNFIKAGRVIASMEDATGRWGYLKFCCVISAGQISGSLFLAGRAIKQTVPFPINVEINCVVGSVLAFGCFRLII